MIISKMYVLGNKEISLEKEDEERYIVRSGQDQETYRTIEEASEFYSKKCRMAVRNVKSS